MLDAVLAGNRFYHYKLSGSVFDPASDPLDTLPFPTPAELERDQADHPPYGTNLTRPIEHYTRLHQTSGSTTGRPMRWLDTPDSWKWWNKLWGMIFTAAGITRGDRLFFPF